MIKHVGKQGDRKVAILYRTVPGEDHMCLVVYSDVIPRMLHDELMGVLESAAGQQSEQLADALFRHIMADGKNALQTLHTEGYIKKVPTNQIVVTPNSTSSVRLDELNDILRNMKQGEEATKKMAEIDKNTGLRDPGKNQPQNQPYSRVIEPAEATVNTQATALSDADIAGNLQKQAEAMKAQATTLLEEAQRLEAEAKALLPKTNARKKTNQKQNA